MARGKNGEEYIARSYSLTPKEFEIVKRAAITSGSLNMSDTLRQIIREWDEMKSQQATR